MGGAGIRGWGLVGFGGRRLRRGTLRRPLGSGLAGRDAFFGMEDCAFSMGVAWASPCGGGRGSAWTLVWASGWASPWAVPGALSRPFVPGLCMGLAWLAAGGPTARGSPGALLFFSCFAPSCSAPRRRSLLAALAMPAAGGSAPLLASRSSGITRPWHHVVTSSAESSSACPPAPRSPWWCGGSPRSPHRPTP